MKLIVHFDGGCKLGRRIAGAGAVVYDEAGTELAARAKFMSFDTVTTPIAEYSALILGLLTARELGATQVLAMGDAELIVRHVDGRYRCRNEQLQPYLAYVRTLLAIFEVAEVREFPKAGPKRKRRYGNARADGLASKAMETQADVDERG